jgi:hypothetical protein
MKLNLLVAAALVAAAVSLVQVLVTRDGVGTIELAVTVLIVVGLAAAAGRLVLRAIRSPRARAG